MKRGQFLNCLTSMSLLGWLSPKNRSSCPHLKKKLGLFCPSKMVSRHTSPICSGLSPSLWFFFSPKEPCNPLVVWRYINPVIIIILLLLWQDSTAASHPNPHAVCEILLSWVTERKELSLFWKKVVDGELLD